MPVKCTDCGFLALKKYKENTFDEADSAYRSAGEIASSGSLLLYHEIPVCFAQAASFDSPEPYRRIDAHGKTKIERECLHYTRWHQGYSPKEHKEMHLVAELERRSQAHRDEDLRWQKQVEALNETRHQDLLRENRQMVIWAIIGGLVAAIVGGLVSGQWGG